MASNAAMPTGVTIAGLGSRALVAFLDALPLSLLSLLVSLLSGRVDARVMLVIAIAATLLSLGWTVFLWWGYSTRGQSPAARLLRIRVLRLADGRPLGWGAYFLRELVWYATLVLPVVWVVLVVMMIVQPRRRGWHDLAAKSVVVRADLPVTPAADARPVQRATVASANMVGLPPHLSQSSFAVEPSAPEYSTDPGSGPIAALPDFASGAGFAPSSGFAPPTAPESGVPWDQWGAAPPVQAGPVAQPYPQAYNPYGQQPGVYPVQGNPQNPYAAQQSYPAPTYGAAPTPAPPAGYPAAAAPQGYPPPGQPSPLQAQAPGPAPAVPSQQPVQPAVEHYDDEMTRTHFARAGTMPAAPRKATEGWQLRLDDGRLVTVDGLVLIGRNPQPQASEQAQLVQAGVESRMVSKTHVAVGLDHRGLYVMDRGSTNGTAIANAGGQFEPCAPGDPVRVREGQIVSFGDRYLEVRRQAQ
ncbi:MAG: RDD family protein [Propionibacteriaceae bacterium]